MHCKTFEQYVMPRINILIMPSKIVYTQNLYLASTFAIERFVNDFRNLLGSNHNESGLQKL